MDRKLLHIEARSADVLIENELAVLSSLPAIQGDPHVSMAVSLPTLERLQRRIHEALKRRRDAVGPH